MKKLIQILIVCGLVVMMGGTASAGGCDYANIFDVIASDDNYPDKAMHRVSILFKEYWDWPGDYENLELQKAFYDSLFNLSKQGNGQASYLAGILYLSDFKYEESIKSFKLSQEQKYLKGYDRIIQCYENNIKRNTNSDGTWGGGEKGLKIKVELENIKKLRQSEKDGSSSGDTIKAEEKNKLVFTIHDVDNYFEQGNKKEKRDEFGELEEIYYGTEVGCSVSIRVKNNTQIKTFIYGVFIYHPIRPDKIEMIFFNKLIKPGESAIGSNTLSDWFKEKDPATEQKKKAWFKEYGCEGQKGKHYISTSLGDGIKFPKDSGVTEDNFGDYLLGSDGGKFPLKKKVEILRGF